MITIPQLDPNSHLLDTDVVMITHSDGTTDKITGADLKSEVLTDVPDFTDNKIQNGDMNPVTSNAVSTILASSRTITGPVLGIGGNIKILFTDNIMGTDTSTPLTITYNGSSKAVKIPKAGALESIYAENVATNTYMYIQKYTILELVYDSVDFIIVGTNSLESNSLNLATSKAVAKAIKTESDNHFGSIQRGSSVSGVAAYCAGIICAIRNGVGVGVFGFTTGGSADGFANTSLISGSNNLIGNGYITRNNNTITIDNGSMIVITY